MMDAAAKSQQVHEELIVSSDPTRHVCSFHTCPHLQVNGDGTLVCAVTGICHAQESVHNIFTAGRACTLDDNGVPSSRSNDRCNRAASRGRRKNNPYTASRRSLVDAASLVEEVGYQTTVHCDDDGDSIATEKGSPMSVTSLTPGSLAPDIPVISPPLPSGLVTSSNGAPPNGAVFRSRRTSAIIPTNITTEASQARLSLMKQQACDMVDSLTGSARCAQTAQTARAMAASANVARAVNATLTSTDTQLTPTSFEAQFVEAGRRYVSRRFTEGRTPLLNDLHDICIQLRQQAVHRSARADAHEAARLRSVRYSRIRDATAQLAVCLWVIVLHSDYMQESRRTGDNFRPFAASVVFGMRNGIKLQNGIEIVPPCELIANALPEARSQHCDRKAQINHLSAHRGSYTFHRCISTIPLESATKVFEPAIRMAKTIRTL
jgi:hypothetical protein